MKSIEQMAKEKIQKYLNGLPQYGIPGFSLDVSVRKAKAATIGWDDVFDRVAKQMLENN